MSKLQRKNKKKIPKAFKKLAKVLTKKQLILMSVAFVGVIAAVSVATMIGVSNSKTNEEQGRNLRTTTLEASAEPPLAKTAKSNSSKASPAKVNFVKGGASLQGSIVVVSMTADSRLNGSCFYTFKLGSSTVERTNTVSDSNVCAINIPLSAFVKSGDWRFVLTYTSSDGKIRGNSNETEVKIVPKVRVISFTKGGAAQNDAYHVLASSQLSEKQSGTCSFRFYLNGTLVVSKTTSITNSNQCSIDIPMFDTFPEQGTYSYVLSFVSNDTLTVAKQDAFDVEIR